MQMESDMRGVLRALSVLRELNTNNGASILELNQATGISRAALYRIVRTLHNAGYLAVDDQTQSFRLTPLVKHLSDGFQEEAWISEIAGPILDRLQQEVIWPTDLFSFFDDTMIMRRTTRRASPWTIDRAVIGFRIPMLITACGRAYLANLPDAVTDGVLERLCRSERPEDAIASEPAMVRHLLQKVRQDGYALREKGFMKETGSIAVPVFTEGVALCSIAVTYISSAIETNDVIKRFVPLLSCAAAEIEREIQARHASTAP
jgi:IclR family transcriptional regulator, mhp operon transcriptional activator